MKIQLVTFWNCCLKLSVSFLLQTSVGAVDYDQLLPKPSCQNNLPSQGIHRHKGPQQNQPNCTVYFDAAPNGSDWLRRVELKVGWVNSQGDLRTITQNWLGWGLEADYNLLPSSEHYIGVSFHVGYNMVRHRRLECETWDAKSTLIGIDLGYAIKKMTLYTGPVLAQWDLTGTQSGAVGERGCKLGWRIGMQFPFQSEWSACLDFTQTEFKSDPYSAEKDGINPCNPSWIMVSAAYHF